MNIIKSIKDLTVDNIRITPKYLYLFENIIKGIEVFSTSMICPQWGVTIANLDDNVEMYSDGCEICEHFFPNESKRISYSCPCKVIDKEKTLKFIKTIVDNNKEL